MKKTLLALALAGCTVEGGKDVPLVVGSGAVAIEPGTQTVKLDTNQVPVLSSCGAGKVVRRDAAGAGWECVDTVPPSAHVHQGLEDKATSLQAQLTAAQSALTTAQGQITALQGRLDAIASELSGTPIPNTLTIASDTTAELRLEGADGASATFGRIEFGGARVAAVAEGTDPAGRGTALVFYTRSDGGSELERMRIGSDGYVRARNLNGLKASAASYTWAQLATPYVNGTLCPSGYHFCVAMEAMVRCYLDAASCRKLISSGDLWVSGNHDHNTCSRSLFSHTGDCWGVSTEASGIPTTAAGYHWALHAPYAYAGANGPSLGVRPDSNSNPAACCPNF